MSDETPTPEERLHAAAEARELEETLGTDRRPVAAGQGPGDVPDVVVDDPDDPGLGDPDLEGPDTARGDPGGGPL